MHQKLLLIILICKLLLSSTLSAQNVNPNDPYDLNNDGVVDVGDIVVISSSMAQPVSSCPSCDLNHDNQISVADLIIMSGKVGTTPPKNLVASKVADSSIKLAWEDGLDEEDLVIERKISTEETWFEIARIDSGVTAFIDDAVTPDTDYYYRVRTDDQYGNHRLSIEATPVSTITLSTISIDFGLVDIDASLDESILVTNIDASELYIFSTDISGADVDQFSLISGGGATTLAPNQTLEVGIRFSPLSRGTKHAFLEISSDAPGSPHSVNLYGTGGDNPLAGSPWPIFRHDSQHTGRSILIGPDQPYAWGWKYTTGGEILSSPAIGNDGTIYVGSEDAKLYAFNQNGSLKWDYNLGSGPDWSSPAIGTDGTIYITSSFGILFAINSDGSLKWSYGGEYIISRNSPSIGPDGTIYFGSINGKLYAVNSDGTLKWKIVIGSFEGYITSAAIGTDGTIYVGAYYNLKAINPTGSIKWTFDTKAKILSSPAIDKNGTIYFGSWNGKLYALTPDGSAKWDFTTEERIDSSPAIGHDGTIYIGSNDNRVYALNPDGTLKWTHGAGYDIISSPAVDGNGVVYVGTKGGSLRSINPDGTRRWSFLTSGAIISSPAIGANRTIYVGSSNANFYAIGGDDGSSNKLPIVAITSPSDNSTFFEGEEITFTGSANDPEDGPIPQDRLIWTSSIDGQIGTGTSFSRSDLSVGTHTITLTATDGQGASGSDQITITVGENKAPIVTISSPANNSTFTQGETITFIGSATDPEDGNLNGGSLVWRSSLDGQIGTGTSLSHSDLSVGTHTITLTVTDSQGATGSDQVTITISAPSNSPPYASASDLEEIPGTLKVGETYVIRAKYSDPDGTDDLKYCYLRLAHPSAPFTITLRYDIQAGTASVDRGKEAYVSPVSVTPISSDNTGLTIEWNFFLRANWPKVLDGIRFQVAAEDASGMMSTWDTHFASLVFTNPEYGATIITHGFQGIETQAPEWTRTMGRAIGRRLGNARVRQLDPESGEFNLLEDGIIGSNQDWEEILILDWDKESNDFTHGYSEAAADAFVAALLRHQLNNSEPHFLDKLHFIGHSRGCIVTSEIIERLASLAFDSGDGEFQFTGKIDTEISVTYIDPHPIWGDHPFTEIDIDQVNQSTEENHQVLVWTNVDNAENYYQSISDHPHGWNPFTSNPDGMPILSAHNRNLDNTIFNEQKENDQIDHFEAHAWYYGTIEPDATEDEMQKMMMEEMRRSNQSADSDDSKLQLGSITIQRALWYKDAIGLTEGFAHSSHGGGLSYDNDIFENDSQPKKVPEYNYQEDAIFNGDFAYSQFDGSNTDLPGWEWQGGGGTGSLVEGKLSLGRLGGHSREHNWFYLPRNAKAIQFLIEVVTGGDATLQVKLESEEISAEIGSWSLNSTPGSTSPLTANMTNENIKGTVNKLSFSLVDINDPVHVLIDNIQILFQTVQSATTVVTSRIEGSNNQYTDLSEALGASDNHFVSLGVGGGITLDMGVGNEIINTDGNDFRVVEGALDSVNGFSNLNKSLLAQPDSTQEGFQLLVSNDTTQWYFLGSGVGTTEFDLSAWGLSKARFVSIVDDGDGDPNSESPGFDLDAVEAIGDFSTDVDYRTDLIPSTYTIYQNYPNPFNPKTVIRYELPKSTYVRLQIFNMLGQRIITLVDDQKPAGIYEAVWDGINEHGEYVSTGLYVYRIKTGEFEKSRKLLFLK